MKKNIFLKNVLLLSSGIFSAQVINILFTPIITRIYGPEEYGVLGYFRSIVTILTPISALTLPIAIVLPKSNKKALMIAKLSLIISILISLMFLILLILFNDLFYKISDFQDHFYYFYLIPIVLFFSSLYQVLEQYLIRIGDFKIISKVTFIQSITLNLLQTGLGLLVPYSIVLVFTFIFSQINKPFIMLRQMRKKGENIMLTSKNSFENYKSLLIEYKDFIKFRAPQAFINASTQGLPVILLTNLFGTVYVGYYSIGKMVLEMPSQLIAKSVGDVIYPRLTKAKRDNENLFLLILKSTSLLALIGIIPFGIIAISAPTLFSFVFGEEWRTAGHYARWISIWSYFGFINRPSIKTLAVLNLQKFHLNYELVSLIVRLISFVIPYLIWSNDLICVAVFSGSGAILNLFLIIFVLIKSKK